jgi:molybdopterin converting factor small subunit
MKVTVKHFATLKPDTGQGPMEVKLAQGATVGDLLSKLGIEPDEVGILIVSGKQATFGQKLKDNELVTLIPHIGGG